MRNKYFILGITALLAIGAGCASTTSTTTETDTNSTTLEVPVDANNNVNETVVVDDTETTETTTGEDDATTSNVTVDDAEEDVAETSDDDATESAVQEFDVAASQFEFTPGTITVKQGDTVKLNLSSEDVPHGFSLAAFDITETLTPGKTTTVEFVADQVGTFSFICNIVCGSGHSGMTGQLIVE